MRTERQLGLSVCRALDRLRRLKPQEASGLPAAHCADILLSHPRKGVLHLVARARSRRDPQNVRRLFQLLAAGACSIPPKTLPFPFCSLGFVGSSCTESNRRTVMAGLHRRSPTQFVRRPGRCRTRGPPFVPGLRLDRPLRAEHLDAFFMKPTIQRLHLSRNTIKTVRDALGYLPFSKSGGQLLLRLN